MGAGLEWSNCANTQLKLSGLLVIIGGCGVGTTRISRERVGGTTAVGEGAGAGWVMVGGCWAGADSPRIRDDARFAGGGVATFAAAAATVACTPYGGHGSRRCPRFARRRPPVVVDVSDRR